MPLPKISTPTYELELPSTEETILYRPFLVKEEKLLVIALESEDTKQITNAIKTVIKNCIITKNIKVETLPTFDIEFLFLNIRGKSVGEELEVNIICPDDGETQVPVKIVVLNNEFLGMVRQWQQLFFDKRYASTEMINPNFIAIAEGYYIKAKKVTKREDLDAAVAEMMASKESYFLEVLVEKENNVFPMIPTGASVSDIRLS